MNKTRPTVWVLKEQIRGGDSRQVFDYTPAYKFGDLKFITDFDLPIHAGSSLAKEWHKNVDWAIGEMGPDDCLILTGQPLAIHTLGAKMRTAGVTLPILVWRREQGEYVVHQPAAVAA